jgi:sugar lactone lactonase YvrE
MRRIFLLASALAFLPIAASAQQLQALITDFSGKAEVKQPGEAWQPAETDMLVPLGGMVSTGFSSRLVLQIGRTLITIRSLTRMFVRDVVKKGATNTVSFDLRVGKVNALVKAPSGEKNDFTVRGPVSTAAVRGTEFNYDANVVDYIQVVEGVVTLTNAIGQTVTLYPGESAATNGRAFVLPGSIAAARSTSAMTNGTLHAPIATAVNGALASPAVTPTPKAPPTIATVAGNGTAGDTGDGGAAASAQVSYPYSVAVDASGALYISDLGNNRIRKVKAGTITPVAGNGTAGYNGDGAATSTELHQPMGIAVDSSGNIYIADAINNRIRKVSGGTITTVAGNGTAGYAGDGGAAVSAELNYPTDVAVDSSGNLYICDYGNDRIRKVSGGKISLIAGNGTRGYLGDGGAATSAELHLPQGVAVDSSGNLFIADTGNHRVRKVSGGTIATVAGNGTAGYAGDGGAATSAELNTPTDVKADSLGNLFIADFQNNRIREVSGGSIVTVAGNGTPGYFGDQGIATSAWLGQPSGVAVDSSRHVYIADHGNSRIREVQ